MREKWPDRQSIRKRGWNYATAGWYFVTINTRGGQGLFGAIVNGHAVPSAAGRVAEECWREIPAHFPEAQIDEFVVMPNHVHGLLRLAGEERAGEERAGEERAGEERAGNCPPVRAHALGDVVGAYKAAVSRSLGRGRQLPARSLPVGASAIWHRNYWDVIVRDDRALANIRQYIRMNPRNYQAVMNTGEPRFLGNRDLMNRPKLGFLASRGEPKCHGQLPVKPQEVVLSGFLSPMERAVFKACLNHRKPMVWVKPWGLQDGMGYRGVREAVADGRLLVVSPFDEQAEAPNMHRAAWCNQYVLAHSDRLIVGHLNPGGMLACVLSEADPELAIDYL